MVKLNKFKTEIVYILFKLYADEPQEIAVNGTVITEHYRLPFFFFNFNYRLEVTYLADSKYRREENLFYKEEKVLNVKIIRHDKENK